MLDLRQLPAGVYFLETAGATPKAVAVNPVTNRVCVVNSARAHAPGVHFVREAKVQAQAQAVRKVVIAR